MTIDAPSAARDPAPSVQACLDAFVRAHRGTTPEPAALRAFMAEADALYFRTYAGSGETYVPLDPDEVVTGVDPAGRLVIAVGPRRADGPRRVEFVTAGRRWTVQDPPLPRFTAGAILI